MATGMSTEPRVSRRIGREGGFSLLETLIATSLMLGVIASVFSMVNPSQGLFATEPEVSDMQQRLRVGADTLARDLVMAGAGSYAGTQAGSLLYYFPPILPFRQGATNDDAAGTFRTDRITILSVPSTTGQTTLTTALGPGQTLLKVASESDCPGGMSLCGFQDGETILVFDDTGNYDTFTLSGVNDAGGQVTITSRPADSTDTTYPIGSKVVEVKNHVYYLKADPVRQLYQLMHYDGTSNADVPLVDHVVGLKFDYYGEPQPPTMRNALSDPSVPGTSYGPKPSAIASPPFGVGENCVFVSDGSPTPAPRLPTLGTGAPTLVQLTSAQLTDGPWCPNDTNANRWDADLLRLRTVAVTLRVEAAADALRGPAGVLFTNGGTSRAANRWAPDLEMRFQASPRNLQRERE